MSAIARLFTSSRAASGGPEPDPGGGATARRVYILPMPPSVNECFRVLPGGKRVKTGVYLDWKGHAGWVLRDQKPELLTGHVVIVLSMERTSMQADVDNRVKATLDLLKGTVIVDDRFVVALCIAWAPPASKLARVMVLPAASYDFAFQLAPSGSEGGWFLKEPQPEPEIA